MNTVYRSLKDYAEKPRRPMSEKLAKDIEAGKRLGFVWVTRDNDRKESEAQNA